MIGPLLAVALAGQPVAAPPEEPRLVPTGVGRFAHYADVASIVREGERVRMRGLQVAEAGFSVGDVVYVGGWSWWAFDCGAGMVDRLDFAALRADGVEGPATPDPAPPYAAAPGGDAAELMVVACAAPAPAPALTLQGAIRHGQTALAD